MPETLVQAQSATASSGIQPARGSNTSSATLFTVALWFGISTGLIEALGLLLFQRINWAAWGHIVHVSGEILWISPLVDSLLFLLLALTVLALTFATSRLAPAPVLVLVLTFLAVYDWLSLTGRLYYVARLLLAVGIALAFARWCKQHPIRMLEFSRKTTVWLVAAFLFVLVGMPAEKWLQEQNTISKLSPPNVGAPDVLFIVLDTLRADHLSAYGYHRTTSPNFDRLAREGVLFEAAVSTCSYSLPSHVSLLTGRYEFEHQVGNVPHLPWFGDDSRSMGGFPTLGEILQKRGYRTAAFSANRTYFSHDLEGRGFIHFEDYFDSPADMFVRTLYGREFSRACLNRSQHSLVTRFLHWLGWVSLVDRDEEGSGSFGGAFGVRKRAEEVNRELFRWIDQNGRHPFLAFLNYFDVHHPYGAPPTYSKPVWGRDGMIDSYDDGVKYVDDFIGHLIEELKKRGRDKNTLLIITSDHGESLGEHHLLTHDRALYWELIHVPLLIRFPGQVPVGVRITTPVTNAALAATVLDLLGGAEPDSFSVPSLTPLWKSAARASTWPGPISELAQNRYSGHGDEATDKIIPTSATGSMKSLATSQWHLIVHAQRGLQLYDLKNDPHELQDVANTAENRSLALSLAAQVQHVTSADSK
jgi:arylsulfatase A-like enzyme